MGARRPEQGDRTSQERLRGQRERIERLRRKIEKKDRELEKLRSQAGGNLDPPVRASAQSPPVFFIVGQAKSGTSWLMRTLNYHPEILCKGEGRFFGRDYKREDVLQLTSKIQPSSLHAAILDADFLGAWIERSVWSRDDDKDEHLAGLTRAAIDYFLGARLAKSGKKIVGDKTPFLNDKITEEIAEIYPDAKVLHIYRDGRDIAVSVMHHLWNHAGKHGGHVSLDPEEEARRDAYRGDPRRVLESNEGLFTEGRIRDLARSWSVQVTRALVDGPKLFGERYAEVRYEDLLERPELEVGRLLRFLGAEAGENVTGRCVQSAAFEKWTKGRERGRENSTALLRKGVAGDWRSVFTDRDKTIFKEEAGDLLVALGYEKDHDW